MLVPRIIRKATVVSVYGRAANILLGDGLLLSLVAGQEQMSSLAVAVPELFEGGAFLREGSAAGRTGGGILAGDTWIDLGTAEPWSGLAAQAAMEVGGETIRMLEDSLRELGKAQGLLPAVVSGLPANRFADRARGVLRAACAQGSPSVPAGLSGLVGLGPGFTPAGDDFLCGALLGERLSRPIASPGRSGRRLWRRQLWAGGQELEKRLGRTNSAGKTLLWLALRGHFPGYLLQAARELLAAGGPAQMRAAVRRAAAHGESSGSDALAGLLWRLRLRL
jgi:hypothetical protein